MRQVVTGLLVWVSLVGLVLPPPALAVSGAPETQAPAIVDVAMTGQGTVVGRVVDAQGAAVARTQVAFRSFSGQTATAVTDEQGAYAVAGLAQGGLYEAAAAGGRGVYRVWQPGTAPPSAQNSAMIVAGGRLVRGQSGTPFWSFSNPIILGGLIGAAVAIPIGVYNSQNNPASP